MKPTLICDFDGTVADSIASILDLINHLAPRFGFQAISPDMFDQIRDLPLAKGCKALKFPLYKIGRAISLVLHEYRRIIPDLDPCPGVIPVLEKLKDLGYSPALISSNHTENLMAWLDHHQVSCFDWVEGTSGILHKHKSIRAQIRKHRLDRSRTLYMGDEARDIKAAHHNRVKIISVTWGLHSEHTLRGYAPDRVVNHPEELLDAVPQLLS